MTQPLTARQKVAILLAKGNADGLNKPKRIKAPPSLKQSSTTKAAEFKTFPKITEKLMKKGKCDV